MAKTPCWSPKTTPIRRILAAAPIDARTGAPDTIPGTLVTPKGATGMTNKPLERMSSADWLGTYDTRRTLSAVAEDDGRAGGTYSASATKALMECAMKKAAIARHATVARRRICAPDTAIITKHSPRRPILPVQKTSFND